MIKNYFIASLIFIVALSEGTAYAMHISEGILPLNWAALWFALALPFVTYGLYSLKRRSRGDL